MTWCPTFAGFRFAAGLAPAGFTGTLRLAAKKLKSSGTPKTRQPKALTEPTASAEHRSEEHTSELQSLRHLVCRLLLEKKIKALMHLWACGLHFPRDSHVAAEEPH